MRGTIRLLLCISLLYGGWKKVHTIVMSPEGKVVVEGDEFLSSHARNTIKLQVQDFLKKSLPLKEISYLLHKTFPQLACVQVTKNPQKSIVVHAQIRKPLALCNDAFVLCENNTLASRRFFVHTQLRDLPRYTVESTVLAQQHERACFAEFVQKCSADIHHAYLIAWNNKHDIHLKHKQTHDTLIITHDAAPHLTRMVMAYQDLIETPQFQERQKKKKIRLAEVIDARFKNQMVIKDMRGVRG